VLAAFLVSNRAELVARTRARVATRTAPQPSEVELTNGIPVFLQQLGDALRRAESSDVVDHAAINESAERHGDDLLRMGLTIGQVVRDYGDVCQTITELAIEQDAKITPSEFQTLNLCLDDAIATAVTAHSRNNQRLVEDEGTERLGVLAHEMRNLLNTAMLSFDAIKSGRVAPNGSTGAMHARSLIRLRDLIDRSLADVRLDAGIERLERIVVAELVGDIEIGALLEAESRHLHVTVTSAEPEVCVVGDRQILSAALSNLLQNAFKFTHADGRVSLSAHATADRVLFDIEDECGGLPQGKSEDLFRPFEQRGPDRSGVGLGLAICRKAAHAHDGEIRVRDLPGRGCVFTLDLPRAL
jgi:signal transduction histidine kinase